MQEAIQGLRNAQDLHLVFLLDTTGSMGSHITKVKEQIQAIYKQLTASGSTVHVGFVGYKDHYDGLNHFEILPFTTDTRSFESFVGRINPGGGGDGPEDVNGGIQQALSQYRWDPLKTNVIFHMCDAPPHGSAYSSFESYGASLQGMRRDKPVNQLFSQMGQLNIDYYFEIPTFDVNVTKLDDIEKSVYYAVSASIASRVKASSSLASKSSVSRKLEIDTKNPRWEGINLTQVMVIEYKEPSSLHTLDDYKELDKEPTEYAYYRIAPKPFAEGGVRYAFKAQRVIEETMGTATSSMRTSSSTGIARKTTVIDGKKYVIIDEVLKQFKAKSRGELGKVDVKEDHDRLRYYNAMEIQTIASFLASEFNRLPANRDSSFRLRYLKSKVITFKDPVIKDRSLYYALERKLPDDAKWLKINNNAGWCAEITSEADRGFFDFLSAFAHWTFQVSSNYLMVVDLQGVRVDTMDGVPDVILLTDPAIHCADKMRFHPTNLGVEGFQRFFKSHTCNALCKKLDLKRPTGIDMTADSMAFGGRESLKGSALGKAMLD